MWVLGLVTHSAESCCGASAPTHSGQHADDLALDLAGRAADVHASQGQLRALVLSLKIAEIQHLYRILQDPPVLLLDDVSSELDPQRNAYLFEFLRTMPCQVFITTTSPLHVKLIEDRQDFLIHGGRIADQPADPLPLALPNPLEDPLKDLAGGDCGKEAG